MRRVTRNPSSAAAISKASLRSSATAVSSVSSATSNNASASSNTTIYYCGLTQTAVSAKDWDAHSKQIDYRIASMVRLRLAGEKGERPEPKNAIVSDPFEQASSTSPSLTSTSAASSASDQTNSSGGGAAAAAATGSFSWAASKSRNATEAAALNANANNGSSSSASSSSSPSSATATTTLPAAKPRPPMFLRFQALNEKPLEPMPFSKVWPTVSRPVRLLQEFNRTRRSKRLARINIALKFLRDHHVIMHSPMRWSPSSEVLLVAAEMEKERLGVSLTTPSLQQQSGATTTLAASSRLQSVAKPPSSSVTSVSSFFNHDNDSDDVGGGEMSPKEKEAANRRRFFRGARAGQWNVSQPFHRLLLNGDALVSTETNVRFSKLFPKADDPEAFLALAAKAVSTESLANLFDLCEMGRIIEKQGRRASPLSEHQKASMLKAMLCELFWFCERTKANDRTHNNALFPPSDVLILHVLAAHVVEAMLSEIVFGQVHPHMERLKRVATPHYSSQHVSQQVIAMPLASNNGVSGSNNSNSATNSNNKAAAARASAIFGNGKNTTTTNNNNNSSIGGNVVTTVPFVPRTPSAYELFEIPHKFEAGVDGLRTVGGDEALLKSILPFDHNDANHNNAANNSTASPSSSSPSSAVLDRVVENKARCIRETKAERLKEVLKSKRKAERSLAVLEKRLEAAKLIALPSKDQNTNNRDRSKIHVPLTASTPAPTEPIAPTSSFDWEAYKKCVAEFDAKNKEEGKQNEEETAAAADSPAEQDEKEAASDEEQKESVNSDNNGDAEGAADASDSSSTDEKTNNTDDISLGEKIESDPTKDGLSCDVNALETAISNRHRKLANIAAWIAIYEKKMSNLEETLKGKLANNHDKAAARRAQQPSSSSSLSTTTTSIPLAIVAPLLHPLPFHRDTIVLASQSDVQLNYKKYETLNPTALELKGRNKEKNKPCGGGDADDGANTLPSTSEADTDASSSSPLPLKKGEGVLDKEGMWIGGGGNNSSAPPPTKSFFSLSPVKVPRPSPAAGTAATTGGMTLARTLELLQNAKKAS